MDEEVPRNENIGWSRESAPNIVRNKSEFLNISFSNYAAYRLMNAIRQYIRLAGPRLWRGWGVRSDDFQSA